MIQGAIIGSNVRDGAVGDAEPRPRRILNVDLLSAQPISAADQFRVIRLLATEWEHTDVDLLMSLPGVVALVDQPLSTQVLDYQRCIGGTAFVTPVRCVSAFTTIYYDTQRRGGVMRVLVGDGSSRLSGFGTVSPGLAPLRNATIEVDLVTHDVYFEHAGLLLTELTKEGRHLGSERAVTWVAGSDVANGTRSSQPVTSRLDRFRASSFWARGPLI